MYKAVVKQMTEEVPAVVIVVVVVNDILTLLSCLR